MKRQELAAMMSRAYELQEILKTERQLVRELNEEYQDLMAEIIESGKRRSGKYEVIDMDVQHQHFIIPDKFRERWPDLFNKLATVTLKDARKELTDKDLETVWVYKAINKPVIVIRGEPTNKAKD